MVNTVFRDPIYGYIRIEYEVIKKLIDTKEFQRLRRIKQLSGVSMVFHMAEHNRFSHSLGTYELAREVLEHVNDVKNALTEYEKVVFLCSALLHDLGHGPYSHSYEDIFLVNHEIMTNKIILGDTEVNKVLKEYNDNLPNDISSIIAHEGKYEIIEDLVSSQLDVDRMDYLLRDAYFTGAAFGEIDYEKILRGMVIRNNRILFKATSVPNIEDYLMSRYHMYYQVYYHPVARCYEIMLEKIYARIKYLIENNYHFKTNLNLLIKSLNNKDDVKSYVEIDDVYINGCIKSFLYEDDIELRILSNKFLNRRLFKYIDLRFASNDDIEKIALLKENPNYYYIEDNVSKEAYSYKNNDQIKILLPNEKIMDLIEFSPIVEAFSKSSSKINSIIVYEEKYV